MIHKCTTIRHAKVWIKLSPSLSCVLTSRTQSNHSPRNGWVLMSSASMALNVWRVWIQFSGTCLITTSRRGPPWRRRHRGPRFGRGFISSANCCDTDFCIVGQSGTRAEGTIYRIWRVCRWPRFGGCHCPWCCGKFML